MKTVEQRIEEYTKSENGWIRSEYEELCGKIAKSEKTAMVNGEMFRIKSDFKFRATFAMRESDGATLPISGSGYISNELTIRKEIARVFGLPTFRKNAKKN